MFLSGVNMKAVSSYFLPVLANCFCSLMTLLFAFVDATCSEPTKNFSQKIISYPLLSLYLFLHIPTLFFQLLIQWLCLSLPTSVLLAFCFYNLSVSKFDLFFCMRHLPCPFVVHRIVHSFAKSFQIIVLLLLLLWSSSCLWSLFISSGQFYLPLYITTFMLPPT